MEIVYNTTEEQLAEIHIRLQPADYENKVAQGLKKIQRQVQMPGFRPGKVPAGLIKKQYGAQVTADEINKLLQDELYAYIEKQQIEILGNPLPKHQTALPSEGPAETLDFYYEIGLAPQFDLKLDHTWTFQRKRVDVDDALIDKYVADVQRSYGTPVYPEVSGAEDVLYVDFNELDAQGEIVPGGMFKSTSINIARHNSELAKTQLVGLKKDQQLNFKAKDWYPTAIDCSVTFGIEKAAAETFNADVRLTVKSISRMEPAALNTELFDRLYGAGTITSEEGFRAKIKSELEHMFEADTDRFFKREVERACLKKLPLNLPDAFLMRWVKAVNEKPLSDDELQKEFPSYADSLRWRLIENRIVKDQQITVNDDEVKQEAKAYISAEFKKYGQVPGEDELQKICTDLLSKEKESRRFYEALYSKKVMDFVKGACTIEEQVVSYDDFFKN